MDLSNACAYARMYVCLLVYVQLNAMQDKPNVLDSAKSMLSTACAMHA